MQANTPSNLRRWERQPAKISFSLVVRREDFMVDSSAFILDFSLRGVGVLTTLELVRGERVRIVANGELPDVIPARVVWMRDEDDVEESTHWGFAGLEFLDH